jgi:Fur family ferric uptake transcriptional regulator
MEDHVQLQKKGLKATHPRLKILDIFEHSEKRHLSAEDVYKIMLNSREEIGLATIYRVLTQFEQAGLLIKHHFENDKANKAIFELNEQSHHDHIVCLQCGNVEEFQNPEIEKLQADVADKLGYNIIEHSLYVYGDCKRKDCACRLGGQGNINKCHK